MRIALIAALGAGVLAHTSSGFAQDRPLGELLKPGGAAAGLSAPQLFEPVQPKNPFGRLFVPATTKASPVQPPNVVCGMTLVPADPKIDTGIRHRVPENAPRFTIRTVRPEICR